MRSHHSMAVPLHATQTYAKLSLPPHARQVPPLFFVVLHGFLAHSGAMNSFVTMLRNTLDTHNHEALKAEEAKTQTMTTATAVPFHITSLDARNHGQSPHTPTHTLDNLVEDLHHYLTHDFQITVSKMSDVWRGCGGENGAHDSLEPPRLIAIGHSMGSITWARYMMDRYLSSLPSGEGGRGSKANATSACSARTSAKSHLHTSISTTPILPMVDIAGLVSLDMPPITRSRMSSTLTNELLDILTYMKAVNLSAISDLRSAQQEFRRCGMTDIRVRGLCSTNLAFHTDLSGGVQRQARWKCNVPVLERSMRSRELFFPDTFYKGDVDVGPESSRADALVAPSVGATPVLSLLGGASPIGGDPQYQQLWKRYAHCLRQHIIPRATHTIHFDQPRETVKFVKHFVFSCLREM